MRRFLVLIVAALVSASNLIQVNDKTFKKEVLESGKFTLVDFYADWCRHCAKLMPTIEELADLYSDVEEIQIAKINGDADGRRMTKKYNVDGFPMLLMFHGSDEPVAYSGMRDLESISNFVQQVSSMRLAKQEDESDDRARLLLNVCEFNDDNFEDQVLKAPHATLVLFKGHDDRRSRNLEDSFFDMAQIFGNDKNAVKFGTVFVDDSNKPYVSKIIQQFGIRDTPTILYFDAKKVDEDGLRRPIPYVGDDSVENLVSFVNENANLSRDISGKLLNRAGRIQQLDEAIKYFGVDTAENVLQKIEDLKDRIALFGKEYLVSKEELHSKDDIEMLSYYSKVVNKMSSGDSTFLSKELQRLEGLVENNYKDITTTARDHMQKRINILRVFTAINTGNDAPDTSMNKR